MKVNNFAGGLSERVDPSLILANEGTTFLNVDNTALTLKPAKNYCQFSQQINTYFYNFKNTWLSSDLERSYTEWKDTLYFTEKGNRAKSFNGAKEIYLGIIGPKTPLVAAQANPVAAEKISEDAEVVQYTYTFYNSEDGIESTPAPLSNELSLAANKVVLLTLFEPVTDVQVDKIRLYRIGADVTEFTLLIEIPATTEVIVTTYTDSIPTLDAIGTLLESENNNAPPLGLQYLIEAYGIFFGILGDKLYFSEIGKPYSWPTLNYIDLSRNGAGLLAVSNGILVFSNFRTDILVGTTTGEFRLLPISDEQGSISHLSGKKLKSIPIWVSAEGICSYNSGVIEVISKDKLGRIKLDIANTAVFDENYHICLTDGTLLTLDARFQLSYKKFKFTNNVKSVLAYDGKLYGKIGLYLVELFAGEYLDLNYSSPKFTEEDYTVTKQYNNVYIRSDGELELRIHIDDEEVAFKTLYGDTIHDVKVPEEKQMGSSIQFCFTGKGTVFEYEYKVIGRQNGR